MRSIRSSSSRFTIGAPACWCATGRLTFAVTYVANPAMVRPNLRPTRDYLDHLLAAADVLPRAYLDHVRAVECWT
ncbi:AIG2-like family protein [Burkholderia pseudomallei]|nr:AIG2-like family protein [Burkholderia pseudomallei]